MVKEHLKKYIIILQSFLKKFFSFFSEYLNQVANFFKKAFYSILNKTVLIFARLLKRLYPKSWKIGYKKSFSEYLSFRLFVYVVLFFVSLIMKYILDMYAIRLSGDAISGIATATSAIIGGSIAIIFTISTFVLQNISGLFSTQYLHEFIDNKSEKRVFFVLALLSLFSLSISFYPTQEVQNSILGILFYNLSVTFFLIYILYRELRRMVNPDFTIGLISKKGKKIIRKLDRYFNFQSFIFNIPKYFNKNIPKLSVEEFYKYSSSPIIIYIKQLYEISLRLINKNEIESSKMAIDEICNIYVIHLNTRSKTLKKIPAGAFALSDNFNDQNVTNTVLEYFQSYGTRMIKEDKKENIIHLLYIYKRIATEASGVNFENVQHSINPDSNPILNLILSYLRNYIDSLLVTQKTDYLWESIKIIREIQVTTLKTSQDHLLLSSLDEIITLFQKHFVKLAATPENLSFAINEVLLITIDRLQMSFGKGIDPSKKDSLFRNLEHSILLSLSKKERFDLGLDNIFIEFNAWITQLANTIFIKDIIVESERDNFIDFFELWSEFLLNFVRDHGVVKLGIDLIIVQSVEQNLRIINFIEKKTDSQFDELYNTQFNIISWYFHDVEVIDRYISVANESLYAALTYQLVIACEDKNTKRAEKITESFVYFVEQLVERSKDSYGYDIPRIGVNLVSLGTILVKYNMVTLENTVLNKLTDLESTYQEKNKDKFEDIGESSHIFMGPHKEQFIREIEEEKQKIYGYSSMKHNMDLVVSQNTTKDDWEKFVSKIKFVRK